ELAELCRLEHPGLTVNDFSNIREDLVILVNGRWLPPTALLRPLDHPEVRLVGEEAAYLVVPARELADVEPKKIHWRLEEWKHSLPRREVGGWMIDYLWELIDHQPAALEQDYHHWAANGVQRCPQA